MQIRTTFLGLALTLFSTMLPAEQSQNLQKTLAVQQAQIQKMAQDLEALQKALADIQKALSESQKQSTEQINKLRGDLEAARQQLSTQIAEKVRYFDPEIGGDFNSFEMTRSADNFCKTNGFLGGVANLQARLAHRGVFCFR
jgi:small-conductance mechanosensitive channel